jgi:hypothetical protein
MFFRLRVAFWAAHDFSANCLAADGSKPRAGVQGCSVVDDAYLAVGICGVFNAVAQLVDRNWMASGYLFQNALSLHAHVPSHVWNLISTAKILRSA